MDGEWEVTALEAATVNLIGGEISLDFTNTLYGHGEAGGIIDEYLTSYTALAAWSAHVGVLTHEQARALATEATRRPADAEDVLRRAVTLREALYRIWEACQREAAPDDADLSVLNGELSHALMRARVAVFDGEPRWSWQEQEDALDRPLWPIARAAAELMTSERRRRVRACPGPRCGWLFLDTSKNGSRRWCAMGSCGNREKARRHYSRRRSESSSV